MADEGTFGGGLGLSGSNPDQGPDMNPSGVVSQTAMGGSAPPPQPDLQPAPVVQASNAAASGAPSFGAGLKGVFGPDYKIDPQQSALDQSASMIDQRMQRAASVASNPIVQLLNPDGAAKARDFVQKAPEALQKIQTQKATVQANAQQAETLGLHPGEGGTTDYSTTEQRVAVAQQRAIKGDLGVFRGLQSVDPKAAEAIQDKVYEAVSGHIGKATDAFGTLAKMTTPQEYDAAVGMLRKNGTITDLEAMGLKVPSFDQFQSQKAGMGRTLREAKMGLQTIDNKLQDRNTYQPMGKDEAATYAGRLTTAYGDKIENGSWSRNDSTGTRGFAVNGMDDPRKLGKSFTLATQDQRKAIGEDWDRAVPKAQLEKYREAQRTYSMATTDPKTGQPLGEGKINTNPNVQQGIAEGMASALRGGAGGANVGLLKIEGNKRGVVQGVIDQVTAAKAGVLNNLTGKDIEPYLSKLTQEQQRYVLDYLHTYDVGHIGATGAKIAERAGALGLGPEALGLNEKEAGGLGDAFERGRQAQVERMMPHHVSIGGGDGVLQLGAQRPGAGAGTLPGGMDNTTQLPGGQPLATPVQQARGASAPVPGPQGPAPSTPPGVPPGPAPSANNGAPAQPGGVGPSGPAPTFSGQVAGQSVNVPLPGGASPDYVSKMQRIESGNEKDPWKATVPGKSSASGAFQFLNSTWNDNKPAGAPARAKDATPQQQTEALATFTAKNAAGLAAAKLPVSDTNLYIAHNLGVGGASKLLTADPNADARNIVGEAAARNNPTFFKGRPTVAQALQRYDKSVNAKDDDVQQRSTGGGAPASFWDKLSGRAPGEIVSIGGDELQGDHIATAKERANSPVVEHAPAIASTVGGMAGSMVGPVGGIAGGAAGGGAGQAFKDWMQGRDQDPVEIAKQTALGGVLGVASEARPVAAAAARVAGVGGVMAGDAALKGGDAGDVVSEGATGAAYALGGEALGRFVASLGPASHRVLSNYNKDAQVAMSENAGKLAAARDVLESQEAKTATGAANPQHEAAQKTADEATQYIKSHGQNPDDMVYAYNQVQAGTGRGEATIMRGAQAEKTAVSQGYDDLRQGMRETGVGTVKANQPVEDGPASMIRSAENPAGKVPEAYRPDAEHAEMLLKAPAKDWGVKWQQMQNAGTEIINKRMDLTAAGDTSGAKAMDALFEGVRNQQKAAAEYVFGKEGGKAVVKQLGSLDQRYAKLMTATKGMNYQKMQGVMAQGNTPERRALEQSFKDFAGNDPSAMRAFNAMKAGAKGDIKAETALLASVLASEVSGVVPTAGVLTAALAGYKASTLVKKYITARVLGKAATFKDFLMNEVRTGNPGSEGTAQAFQRGMTM